MNIMVLLVIMAALCVLGSLVLGIAAMANHGSVAHRSSEQWMSMRVGFQGLALVLTLIALVTA